MPAIDSTEIKRGLRSILDLLSPPEVVAEAVEGFALQRAGGVTSGRFGTAHRP